LPAATGQDIMPGAITFSEMPPAAAGMETYMLVEHLSSAPNPQFSRPGWRDQNGTWLFRFDDHDVGLAERWYANPDRIDGSITVPYPPESPLSGVGDRSYHRVLWYARTLDLDSLADGEHQLLHFGAVDFRRRSGWTAPGLVHTLVARPHLPATSLTRSMLPVSVMSW
jgi:hypothetical protein